MKTAAPLFALIVLSASVVNAKVASPANGLNPSTAGGATTGGGSTTTQPTADPSSGTGGANPGRATKQLAPVDCAVSAWKTAGPCDARKMQLFARTVVRQPANGGKACPALIQLQACAAARPATNTPPHAPVDCRLSDWQMWTPCSNGTRQRARTIMTLPANGGKACPKVLAQTERCGPIR